MKNVILNHVKPMGLALIARVDDNNRVSGPTPSVVAMNYSEKNDDWLYGHYFSKLKNAVEKYEEIKADLHEVYASSI